MAEKNLVREAVIDLGTNTFNLLIAELENGCLTRIHNDKLPVLLGMGGINEGVIAGSAMQRAKDALQRFYNSCEKFGVEKISGIGTSALRVASNSQDLLDYALEELGIEIEIVSGMREAELIYHGVRLSHDFKSAGVIMDIGGGSTEFIGADNTGIQWAQSFDIGVSRIFQQLGQPDEFFPEHIQAIINFLETESKGHFGSIQSPLLVGASGSFETMYEMAFKQEFPQVGKSIDLPLKTLKEGLEWGIRSTLKERMDNDWVIPIRKKMLPVAAVKVKWVLEQLDVEQVKISPYSLKEGVFSREF